MDVVADWIFMILDRLGAVGVGLLIFLENVVPPIPSEVILPLAGFRTRTGTLNVLTVWPAATAGSVLGAVVLYALGSGVWNAAFLWLGWLLGENWDQVQGWLGPGSYVVIGLLVVGLAVLAVRRARATASP